MLKSIKPCYAALLVILILAGCSSGRKVFVEHDYSYETNFKDYSSYTFLECERDTNNLCTEIYEAIRRQMQVRGYKLTAEKPTLLGKLWYFLRQSSLSGLYAAGY